MMLALAQNKFLKVILALSVFSALLFSVSAPQIIDAQNNKGIVEEKCADGGVDDCDLNAFVKTIDNLMSAIIALAAAFATILFVYAGWLYLSSQGNSSKIEQAKKIIFNAIVGFLIILLAWLIVTVVLGTLVRDGSDAEKVFENIFGQLKGL